MLLWHRSALSRLVHLSWCSTPFWAYPFALDPSSLVLHFRPLIRTTHSHYSTISRRSPGNSVSSPTDIPHLPPSHNNNRFLSLDTTSFISQARQTLTSYAEHTRAPKANRRPQILTRSPNPPSSAADQGVDMPSHAMSSTPTFPARPGSPPEIGLSLGETPSDRHLTPQGDILLLRDLDAALCARLPDIQPDQVAQLARLFLQTRFRPERFLDALSSRSPSHPLFSAQRLSPLSVTGIVSLLAHSRKSSPDLISHLGSICASTIDDLSPEDLAHIANAFSKLVDPVPELFVAIAESTHARGSAFNGKQIALIVHSFTKHNYGPIVTNIDFQDSVPIADRLKDVKRRVVSELLQPSVLDGHLPIAHESGSLSIFPGSVLKALIPQIIIQTHLLNHHQLSLIAYSYAHLNTYDHQLFEALTQQSLQSISTFSPQSLATMANALSITKNTQTVLLDAITHSATSLISKFKPLELSMLTNSLASLRHSSPEFISVAEEYILNNLTQCNSHVLMNMVNSLGLLGLFRPQFYQKTAEEFERRVGTLTMHQHQQLLSSFVSAKFRYPPLFDAVAASSLSRLRKLVQISSGSGNVAELKALVAIFHNFAALNYRPVNCLTEFYILMQKGLPHLDGPALARFIEVCKIHGSYPPHVMNECLSIVSLRLPKTKPSDTVRLVKALDRVSTVDLPTRLSLVNRVTTVHHVLSPSDLCSVIQVFGNNRYPAQNLARLADSIVSDDCNSLSVSALVDFFSGCMQLKVTPAKSAAALDSRAIDNFPPAKLVILLHSLRNVPSLPSPLLQRATDLLCPLISSMPEPGLVRLIQFYSLHLPPDRPEVIDDLVRAVCPRAPDMSPQNISLTANALSKHPEAFSEFFSALVSACTIEKLAAFSNVELAVLAHALGKVRLRDQQLMDRVAQTALCHERRFDPIQIAQITYAFSILGISSGPLYSSLATQAQLRLDEFKPSEFAVVVRAFHQAHIAQTELWRGVCHYIVSRFADLNHVEISILRRVFEGFESSDASIADGLAQVKSLLLLNV
ncbi:uncharacterized protein BJ171DRAFT_178598 [Polychytrium aggregatum]|uniref:uncharacterized protein n=1 Tax=Polychytrium aggregatum TaxID=110093 RepID=UPI0022FE7881|nr:uncharacterized protein BJ171DRAFT_178598 [Polychytrium aggregatum]KAI9202602.1 hypothetical protein BJ171DRAFT_178598 [Polychytrium aggregatum]